MKSIPPTLFGLLFVLTILFNSSLAFGQSTITQVGSFSNVPDPADQTLSFNKFDPSLGTLTSVEIDLTNVFVTGTASVTNNSGGNSKYTISLTGDYAITDSLSNQASVVLTTPSQSTTGNLKDGNTFTTITETNATAGSGSVIFSNPASLALYIGTGTTGSTVVLSSANSVDVTFGASPYSTLPISTGSGSYDLIYTYTPVPEPSKTAAMMIGFAMCLFLGRAFHRKGGRA